MKEKLHISECWDLDSCFKFATNYVVDAKLFSSFFLLKKKKEDDVIGFHDPKISSTLNILC